MTRYQQFATLFPKQPNYRWQQIERSFFEKKNNSWKDVTTLPQDMRQQMDNKIPWISHKLIKTFVSKKKDTYKAVLETLDEIPLRYETVLMDNIRGQWTICVSSQIGCAMGCNFCATGAMGFKRDLTADEIVDQFRFWQKFLLDNPKLPQRISNIVFMGMGEPLANYDNVKQAIITLLSYTDLGPTKITVSTVGVMPRLEKILTDAEWPAVRIAISLHSSNTEERKKIVPTTIPDFLPKLADWCRRYEKILGNRNHHVTFEYILLNEVNDKPEQALELAKFVASTGANKINVIPYNPVAGKNFSRSQTDRINQFKNLLRSKDIDVTQRRTMGDDIAAACGQLIYQSEDI